MRFSSLAVTIAASAARSQRRAQINIRKKTVKKSQQNPNGGFVNIERPIHISNVQLLSKDEKPVRLRARMDAKKKSKELYYLGAGKKAVVYRGAKEGTKG
jgi:large subunit ribosomal protein L24